MGLLTPDQDECPNHICPKCGVRMTNRQCLTCKRKDGTPVRVRFCADCDGGPIVIDNPAIVETVKRKVDEFWGRGH